MTDKDTITLQLQREQELNTRAYDKWKRELSEQEQKGDGANTPMARKMKSYYFDDIVRGLQEEIDNPTRVRSSYATNTIRKCLGITLTYKKDKRTGEKILQPKEPTNQFDLELAVFIALQIAMENALMPAMKEKTINRKSGQEVVVYPAGDRASLIEKIAKRVEQQIYFAYVEKCFPAYFETIEKSCSGGGDIPRSSSHYFRFNMMRALKNKAEALRKEGKNIEADAMEFKPFGADRKHIGSWLLSGLIKYSQLFTEETINLDGKTQQVYVVLSESAKQYSARYIAEQKRIVIDDMPMLCPPVAATDEHFGSWLLSSEILTPLEHKGALKISPQMKDYINHLQRVKYQVNPFIYQLLEYLHKRNGKLGKFIPHEYEEPMDLAQALGVVRRGDYEAETSELVAKGDAFKQAKKQKSLAKAKQLRLVEKGRRSKQIFRALTDLHDKEGFYYPHMWDFRGRAYCLCKTSPEPQGMDYQKAAVMFAEPQPIDARTKFWLSVEIANNAGVDKVSFSERIKWVEQHQSEITLVATMFRTGFEQEAISYLDTIDNPFQFAAACEEYYSCFIAKDRKTTTIRVGVDMSCSAAGIHAGWKLDAYDAEAVNITPSNAPEDLYKRVWDALVENNKKHRPYSPIRSQRLTALTEEGYGRKISKKMIMVFQYSAGIKKQMSEFYKIHDDLPEHLQLDKDEVKAFRELWTKTTSETMSVDSVIAWFQARVEEIYKSGKTEVLIPNATGSVQVMKYPLMKKVRQVQSFHNGRFTEYEDTGKPDIKAWKRAITANATHMTDSAIMAIALHDFPYAFSTIHDAAHTYATEAMDLMTDRLKDGYVQAVGMDIWDKFREINGLPIEPATDFPKTNTLNLEDVRHSDYIFA